MTILLALFYFFSIIVLYVYLGYPLLLYIMSFLFKKTVNKSEIFPKVSIIIAAYNEEKAIREKIENTLHLNYPKENLQVIVASDCATDKTNEIVSEFKKDGVVLYIQKARKGKTKALNDAVRFANGEILVFTDATAILEKDCLSQIVTNFNDPNVGCVCPYVSYINMADNNITQIEGCYRKYEAQLKQQESTLGSLAFVPGACFAIRRELHQSVDAEYDYDCITPLDVISQKHRVVYDAEAKIYETIVTSSRDLFKTKVRMITKDFAGTLSRKKLLNPFKYHWIPLTLLSHKLVRWMIPFLLILIFICNLLLLQIQIFQYLLIVQISYYFLALIGFLSNQRKGFLAIPSYFCIVNLAALVGVSKAIIGEKIPIWQPVR